MDSPQDTLALVRAAQGGDSAAREALFARYRPRALCIAALRLGRPRGTLLDAEDVAQEALVQAFRGFDGFQANSEGAFCNWLSTIVTNRLRDHLRRGTAQKRGEGRLRSLAACPQDESLSTALFAGSEPSPSAVASAHELEERIEAALLSLDERSRRVVEMSRLCGMSHAEVVAELGLKGESHSRAILARAMARLSAVL